MEVTPATSRRLSTQSLSTFSSVSSGMIALAGYTSPVELVEDVVGGFQQLARRVKEFYREGRYNLPTTIAVARQQFLVRKRTRAGMRRVRGSIQSRVGGMALGGGYSRLYWLKRPSRK